MSDVEQPQQPRKPKWWSRARLQSFRASSTRRALLLTALGGLLIGGISTTLPAGADESGRLAGVVGSKGASSAASQVGRTFRNAHSGDCLTWPKNDRDQATIVECKNDHRFEVAEAVDMSDFPGTEYASNAAAPSAARIQQINQEQCPAAVKRFLGAKYDPNGRFTVGMMWPGTKEWAAGERTILCGLKLEGAGRQPQVIKGRVAELDQSKVWPAGTCIGIEPATNDPTDFPVDCAAPHAMEVTGTVNLADKYPDALPPASDREAFLNGACTKMTDTYLAPVQLRATTLTLTPGTMTLASWTAGSRQVSCLIGGTLGTGGWSTLVGSAKGQFVINGQAPNAPPDIPEDRLNMPPIPFPIPMPTTIDASGSQYPQATLSGTMPAGTMPTGNQHLPNAPGPQTIPTEPPAVHTPDQPGQVPGPGGPSQEAPEAPNPIAPPPAEPPAPAGPPPAEPPPPGA